MMPMILAMLGVFMMTSMGGCDKDKNGDKKAKEQMINACLHDETGECQRKAAAWAAAHPDEANMAAEGFMKQDQDGKFLTTDGETYSINDQAKKVKDGLDADRNNPKSLYYDPDDSGTTGGDSNLARDPSSELPVAIVPKSIIDESAGSAVADEGGGQKPVYGATVK